MFAEKETMTDPVKEFTEILGSRKVKYSIRFLSLYIVL